MEATHVASDLFVFMGSERDQRDETDGEPGPSGDAAG